MKRKLQYAAPGNVLCVSSGGDAFVVDAAEARHMPEGDECVGIVFSTSTDAYDAARGFAHGYALALTDAAPAAQWAADEAWQRRMLLWRRAPRCAKMPAADNLFRLNGLQNARIIGHDADYPAFAAAAAYGAGCRAKNLSEWFLPSAGQWMKVLANLGGTAFSRHCGAASIDKGCVCSGGNDVAAILNERFAAVAGGAQLFTGDGDVLWSSTPAQSRCAYGLACYRADDAVAVRPLAASMRLRVRPVIAF